MILSSTVRKLAAQRAIIYAVAVPAHTVRLPSGTPQDVSAIVEWFATKSQADNSAKAWRGMSVFGIPDPVISCAICTMTDHYLKT